jgi:carbonic anhydrase
MDELLKKNRAWAKAMLEGDPAYFTRHSGGQSPRVLWVGCSDSRVPAEQILGCGPGELFIHRNVANIVAYNDVNISAVLQYAVDYLQVPDIVVCGHYGCGGVEAACSHRLADGYIGDWLNLTEQAQRSVDVRLGDGKSTLPKEKYLEQVVEQNVRQQVEHLGNLSIIRRAWETHPGTPRLHGWVYDIHTGLVEVISGPHAGKETR